MPTLKLTFTEPINTSVQPGDTVYYVSNVGNTGGFDNSNLSNITLVGDQSTLEPFPISNIGSPNCTDNNPLTDDENSICIDFPATSSILYPADGDFIMFSKDNKVGVSGVLGYYSTVKFVNNSKTRAELFQISSEIFESSK